MVLSSKKTRDEAAKGRGTGAIRLPQGRKFLKIDKPGTFKLAILPYTVPAGAKHPYAKDGELHYYRDYFIHYNLGEDGKGSAICPKQTKGGKCPICSGIDAAIDSGELTKETAKKYYAKQRSLFNVYLPEQNSVLLLDYSYHLFTKLLNKSVSAKVALPGREWIDYFADPVEGAYIYVTFDEKAIPGGKCFEAVSFDFDRHGGLPQEILSQALPLDDLLVIESPEVLKAKFYDEEIEDSAVAVEAEAPAEVSPTPTPIVHKPLEIPKPAVPEPKVQRPVVTTTLPPATASAPAEAVAAWPAKGAVVYHRTLGQVTVHKNSGQVITVLDKDDEPVKAKLSDLKDEPWPEDKPVEASPQPESAPASAESGDDDSWDADWDES